AGREFAAATGHADGEQAAALLQDHGHGAGVDGERAARALEVGDPAIFGFEGQAVGHEEGAGAAAGEQAGEDVGLGSAGDEDAAAGAGGEPGGGDLGNHAAGGGDVGGAAGHGLDFRGDLFYDGDDLAGAVHVDQAGCGGEDGQVLGVELAGHHGREGVVVAELDLGRADGVVFVDDRHGAVGEELFQAGLDAEVALATAEVLMGEQYLRDGEAVRGEALLPGLHEQGLADGGAGLFFGEVGGFALEAEAAHAEADRAGGDDDDLDAVAAERGDAGGEGGDPFRIQLPDTGGEHAGAELDDDAPGFGAGGCGHGGGWARGGTAGGGPVAPGRGSGDGEQVLFLGGEVLIYLFDGLVGE